MSKILHFILALVSLLAFAPAQVQTILISEGVVPGETIPFFILVTNGESPNIEKIPDAEGLGIRYKGSGFIGMQGAKNNTALYFEFEVAADKPGTATIPSFTLQTESGNTYRTAEKAITVYPFSEIQWHEMPKSNGKAKYGTLWHIPNKTPYINQPVRCEIKIYAPPFIVNYQFPTIQKNGIAANNFTPSLQTNDIRPLGTALLQGQDWRVMTFNSTFNPLRAGDISMSGNVSGYALAGNQDAFMAQFTQNFIDIPLPLPEIKLRAKDFPPGAPKDFTNAVGQFRIKTSTQAPDLSANEPVMVDITVEGTGNIGSIACPAISDPSRWKLYPATKMGNTADNAPTGSIHFQQSMRPIEEIPGIPAFSLSFFDPVTEQYHTATSAPIPLPWKKTDNGIAVGTAPAAQPPAAGIVPVDKMTDIYGIVPAETINSLVLRSSWKWYLLAYIPFLALAGLYTVKTVKRKRNQSAASRQRLAEFKSLDTKLPSSQFLRAIGSFIETRIPKDAITPELQDILRQRDDQAFLPEDSAPELSAAQRTDIIKRIKHTLSKLSILLLASFLIGSGILRAQDSPGETSYSKGEYSQALKEYSAASSDPRLQAANYYGQGNSLYRLNKPGEAALAYRKALNIAPFFTEAERNLQFIQRKEGAILPPVDTKNEWLTFTPKPLLLPIILVSGAVTLTCLALLFMYRRQTVLLATLSLIFAIITASGIANLILYPQTPSTIDQNRLLVATRPAQARHAADRDSPSLMTIPPSTPLILQAKRGSWYYIKTFTGTPAWIEASQADLVGEPSP